MIACDGACCACGKGFKDGENIMVVKQAKYTLGSQPPQRPLYCKPDSSKNRAVPNGVKAKAFCEGCWPRASHMRKPL